MKTLCQDCLRVIETSFEDYIKSDYGKGLCVCSGEVCNCDSCYMTIAELTYHNWSKPYLGLLKPILAWTPEVGAVICSSKTA